MAENDRYVFAKMSTVLSFSIDGFKTSDMKRGTNSKIDSFDKEVEKAVKAIIEKLKASHGKFVDPDFGPTADDPHGAKSLYGDEPPTPAGVNKYPSPESIRWDRPQYSDDKFDAEEEEKNEEEVDEFGDDFGFSAAESSEVWCMNGELFIDGSSSGDVIQGKLGDCWFLGALAVLGTREDLLAKCFWRLESFKEFGLFVCVFYKDCALRYVIIDDRIPVFANSGKVVFAQCKDPNELWVPLIEKAYAKLHGCYKALIGGYVHFGLADMTGFAPRLVGIQPGHMGYSDAFTSDQLWKMLRRYRQWNCLMGASIQAKPNSGVKVEAAAPEGLKYGHAYSFLDVGTITDVNGREIKLVKLRNPWGFGEWTGKWGDTSKERTNEHNAAAIAAAFQHEGDAETTDIRANDGTFFMAYDDWKKYFTSLFVAINFPPHWEGKMSKGRWSGDVGGPREMTTWMSNPKIKLRLPKIGDNNKRAVFIGLYIHDTRMVLGKEYYTDPLYQVGVGFDVVTEDEFSRPYKERLQKDSHAVTIPGGCLYVEEGEVLSDPVNQPPYMFGTTQVEAMLDADTDYYIVPSLRQRKQSGIYFVHVYADGDFELENGVTLQSESEVKKLYVGNKEIQLTEVQFAEKTEELREKLLSESKKLGITLQDMTRVFRKDEQDLPRADLKRRLIGLGFSLADFPDEDFIVLDKDSSGSISVAEFIEFFEEGVKLETVEKQAPPPVPPPDDLAYAPIDLEGVLNVRVIAAKNVRKASAWFSNDCGNSSGPQKRSVLKYNADEAAKAREEIINNIDPPAPSATKTTPESEEKKSNTTTANESSKSPPAATPGKYSTLPGFEDAVSVASVNAAASAYVKQTTEKIGLDAGVNLHDDTLLQKKEIDRTKFLGLLRARQGDNAAKKVDPPSTMLVNPKEKRVLNNAIRAFLGLPPVHEAKEMSDIKIKDEIAPPKEDVKLEATLTKALSGPVKAVALEQSLDVKSAQLDADKAPETLHVDTAIAPSKALNHTTDSPRAKIGIHQGGMHDFWDMIIDRVSVIAECRSKEAIRVSNLILKNKRRFLPSATVQSLSTPKSAIPTPMPAKGTARISRGTRPSISMRPTPLATSSAVKAQEKTKAALLDVKDALKHNDVDMGYVEIYRRLVTIPVVECREIDKSLAAERLSKSFIFGSNVKTWFEFFDKNNDGEISFQEFFQSLKELNIELSKEDTRTLFLRFETREQDGLIDWREFMDFYRSNIEENNKSAAVKEQELVDLVPVLDTLVHALEAHGRRETNELEADAKTSIVENSDSYLDIADISTMQVRQNTQYFRSLGVDLSETTMARISRVFSNDVTELLAFLRAEALHDSPFTVIMEKLTVALLQSIADRCGKRENLEFATEEDLRKMWLSIASSFSEPVTVQQLSRYFCNIIVDSTQSKSVKTKVVAETEVAKNNEYMGHDVSVLCNLIVEQIAYSHWNKRSKSETGLRDTISFSSFHAFLKRAHVSNIERKLKYLMHLQSVLDTGCVSYLVHAFVPTVNTVTLKTVTGNLCSHILLIAYDPLTSTAFKLKVPSDVAGHLPQDHAVVDMIRARYRLPKKLSLPENILDAARLYNPWETPMEDQAISNGHDSVLMISEDLKFIKQLKQLLDKADLPFFYAINELMLRFEMTYESVKEIGSMAKLVFSSVRRHPALKNFLMNVLSDMTVQLRTYDHQMSETMTWTEMIAYLSSNRNPFVTLQLLPKYIEPKEGMKSHLPEFLLKKYGFASPNRLDEKALLDEDDDDSDALIYKSKPDIDGGSHPSWEQQFTYTCTSLNFCLTYRSINFKPPSLTNCKIVITDVAKLRVEDSYKYVIIMVREAKDKSLFMTAYDPRSATEYMLFGSPPEWMIPGITDDSSENKHIFYEVYPNVDKSIGRLDVFQEQLSDIINLNDDPLANVTERLHLGFAITPRLLISVYNAKNTSEELLGYSQVSLSSVLSGTGNVFTKWSALMYEMVSANGTKTFGAAGAVHLQMGYMNRADIEAGMQSKVDRQQRIKDRLQAKKARSEAHADSVRKTSKSHERSEVQISVESSSSMLQKDAEELAKELKQIRHEAETLRKEREAALRAKQDMEKELSVRRAEQDKPQAEPEGMVRDNKAEEELKALKASYEKLQRETEELKKQPQRAASATPPTIAKNLSGVLDEDHTTGQSLDGVVHSILEIFIKRFRKREKEDPSTNPLHVLRPLVKISTAYGDASGRLTLESIGEIFDDLLIDISAANAKLLFESMGKTVSVGIFNELFLTKLCAMLHVDVPMLNSLPSVSAPAPPQPAPAAPPTSVSTASQDKEDVKLSQTAPVKLQQPAPPVVPPPEKIDWDTHPLPPGGMWERRQDKNSGKMYYLNHETKSTQWRHPLAPAKRRGRGDAMSKTMHK